MVFFNVVEIDGLVIVKFIVGDDIGVVVIKEKDFVSWEVNGELLVVMVQYEKNCDVLQIEIMVSDFKVLFVMGLVILEGKGEFVICCMEIKLSGQLIVLLDVDIEIFYVCINLQSILILLGNVDDFNLDLNSQFIVNVEDLEVVMINVSVNNQLVVIVNSNGVKVNFQVNN